MTIVMTFDYCMSASLIVLSFVIVLAKHYIHQLWSYWTSIVWPILSKCYRGWVAVRCLAYFHEENKECLMMTQCLAASASIHIFTSSRLSLLSKEIYLQSPIFPPVQCRGVFCSDSTVHSAPALQDRCQCTLHTLPPTLLLYTPLHTLQLQAVLSNHTLHHVSLSCHDITIHCTMSPYHAMI